MNYSSRVDKIFGVGLYNHRTLRTLFDTGAAEWDNTSIAKKTEILTKILASGYSLSEWIKDYLAFYKTLNKGHVRLSLPEALGILRKHSTDPGIIEQIDLYMKSMPAHK